MSSFFHFPPKPHRNLSLSSSSPSASASAAPSLTPVAPTLHLLCQSVKSGLLLGAGGILSSFFFSTFTPHPELLSSSPLNRRGRHCSSPSSSQRSVAGTVNFRRSSPLHGISLLLDLYRRNPSITTRAFHSSRHILSPSFGVSATLAAAAFASNAKSGPSISYCDSGLEAPYSDAGADLTDIYLSKLKNISGNLFGNDILKYNTKIYPLEIKPLFSAFYPVAFASTTIRSFLIYYLPLLEPPQLREDDDDFPDEVISERDFVAPFYKSLKQVAREVSVVTTRRILERIAANNVSQRAAWKLIKDVPKSARRKAGREMASSKYLYCMCRTTFRGHVLAAVASWLVQVGVEIYRCFKRSPELEDQVIAARLKLLARKVFGVTIKCSAALALASVGSGIGATLIHPSIGAVVGCAAGDVMGPVCAIYVFDRYFNINIRYTD